MPYQVVLFDLDGTLLNTNRLILASFVHTFAQHCPGKYTEEDVISHMGAPLEQAMNRFDPNQIEAMMATYHEYNKTYHDEYAEPFPDVKNVLEQMHKQGIPMGVVSNKRREMVEIGLDFLQITPWIDSVVCEGDGKPSKPEPDMLQQAMSELRALPEETVMIGDSRYDAQASSRAGVAFAGVAWSMHYEELKQLKPDHFLYKMSDLLPLVGMDHA